MTSIPLGAPSFCQYEVHIWSGNTPVGWRCGARYRERKQIWKTRSGRERAARLPGNRWDSLAAAEKDPGLKGSSWWDLFQVWRAGATPASQQKITKILPPSSLHLIPFLIQLLTRRTKLHNSWFPLRLYRYITATFGTWISPEQRPLLSQTPFPGSDSQRNVQINWKLQDILCQLPQWFSLISIWSLLSAGSFSSSDLCLRFTCKYCQIFGTLGRGEREGGVFTLCTSLSQKTGQWHIDEKPDVTKASFESIP